MIDTPFMPADSLAWRRKLADKVEIRYIINTHYHLDHISGNYYFPGTVICHEKMREMYTAPLARVNGSDRYLEGLSPVAYYRKRMMEKEPDGPTVPTDYYYRPADITFGDRLNLFVGDRQIKLMHLPGHTGTDIGAYLPEEKILFAGDTVCNQEYPSFAHSVPIEWLQSLKTIQAMDAKIIVPGHGRICNMAVVREFTSIVEKCIDMVRDAIQQGMGPDEAVQRISFDGLMAAHHSGPGMHRRNISRLYQMLL
jgi:cyclase